MTKNALGGEGSVFQFSKVRTARDIPPEIWERAMDDLKRAFPLLQRAGEVPTLGGSIKVNGSAPPLDQWHFEFRSIMAGLDGTPLAAASVAQD